MVAGTLPRELDILVKFCMRAMLLVLVVAGIALSIYFPVLGIALIAFIAFSSPAYRRLIS